MDQIFNQDPNLSVPPTTKSLISKITYPLDMKNIFQTNNIQQILNKLILK